MASESMALAATEISVRQFARRVGRRAVVVEDWCGRGLIPARLASSGRHRIRREVAEEYFAGRRPLPDGEPLGGALAQQVRRELYGAVDLLASGAPPAAQRAALAEAVAEIAAELGALRRGGAR